MTQHSHKAALFNFKTYSAKALQLIAGVSVMNIFKSDISAQVDFLSKAYLSQRQVAPQGRHRPVSVTGRPSSWLSAWPPYFLVKILSAT